MWPFKKKVKETHILTPRQIKEAHKLITTNKQLLAESQMAGCYYCLEIYPAKEVEEFLEVENTALCPKCGIDCVLGDKIDFPLNKEVLQELHNFWFSDRGWSIFTEDKDSKKADVFVRNKMTKDDRKKMPWILELLVTPKFANDNLSQEEKLKLHSFIDDIDTELREVRKVESIVKLNWFVYEEAFFCLDKPDKVDEILKEVSKKYSPEITWQTKLTNDPKWDSVSHYLKI